MSPARGYRRYPRRRRCDELLRRLRRPCQHTWKKDLGLDNWQQRRVKINRPQPRKRPNILLQEFRHGVHRDHIRVLFSNPRLQMLVTSVVHGVVRYVFSLSKCPQPKRGAFHKTPPHVVSALGYRSCRTLPSCSSRVGLARAASIPTIL